MCDKRNSAKIKVMAYSGEIRTDKCMKPLIDFLWNKGINTRACCCGHGKYPMSIVVWIEGDGFYEIVSGIKIPRETRFYRKDKQGFYYIPEVVFSQNEVLRR